MADHPLLTAATAESGLVQDTLLDAFMKRMPLAIGPTEDLVDIVQSIGSVPLAIVHATTGTLYFYDETDTTTADDGITCLVDGNGHRYKAQESAVVGVNSVLAISDTPPGSPSLGDAYVIDVAPTGAWAANAKNIAIWTARGWVFATPSVGTTVLNEDTGANIQYSAVGIWGAFVAEIGAGAITPTELEFPSGLIVEDTLNTPPGSPTTGKFWIVGSVPTGAFVGHGADLAYWTGSAWAFLDPSTGWSAYHKASGFEVYYASGTWLGDAGSEVQTFSTAGGATWTKPGRGSMALVQVWGAGGSGARAGGGDGGGGGGGGSYNERWITLASLGATESVTVGAGGAARTSDDTNGAAGGNSSFGSWVTAYGGGGGGHQTSVSGGGGGGAGQYGAGASSTSSAGGNGGTASPGDTAGAGGAAGNPGTKSITGGGGGGGGSSGSDLTGGGSTWGGGGGGGGNDSADGTPNSGGASMRGGGGGGGGGSSSARFGAGGASLYSGAGGAGGYDSVVGTDGAQPGGGGGGSESGNSGKGGDGRIRVTVV